MTDISRNWYDLSVNSNVLKQTYIDGFIDVSNNIVGRENIGIKNEKNEGDTRFGLGTLDPSATLHIMNDDATLKITNSFVTSATSNNTNLGKIEFATPTFNGSTVTGYQTVASIRSENLETEYDYDGSLIFSTNNSSGNLTDRMTIRSNGNIGIGTSNPTSKLSVNGDITITNGTLRAKGMVPIYGIITWSGTLNNNSPQDVNGYVYTGWKLCDGSNYTSEVYGGTVTTPDLRNRFIVSTGSSYSWKATGGADTVTLSTNQIASHNHSTNSTGGHSHSLWIGNGDDTNWDSTPHTRGAQWTDNRQWSVHRSTSAGYHNHGLSNTGGGGAHENRPPYYVIAYIMRIS